MFATWPHSAEIMLDLNDIFSLPFGFGETMQNAADLIPRARRGDDQEYFLPPLARPKVSDDGLR